MLPDFVVIGGMKCGTTALWRYLRTHPEVYVPQRKNLYFFIEQDNWGKGLDWYESFFKPETSEIKAIGEVSTEYTKYPYFPNVAANMALTIPNVKLIYLIRHPIRRIISQYIHAVNAGTESRSINEALETTKDNPYVVCSSYFYQLQQFLAYYPKERILLLTSEALRDHPTPTLKTLYEFIEVDPNIKPVEHLVVHTSAEKRRWNALGRAIKRSPKYFNYYNYYLTKLPVPFRNAIQRMTGRPVEEQHLTRETILKLFEVLGPDIEKLEQFAGEDFPSWDLGFSQAV